MPTPYEARRLSGTDLGKTITGTNRDNEPFNGPLTKLEQMPNHTIVVIHNQGHWLIPESRVTITGQPSPTTTPTNPSNCGHNGGQGIGAGHTCQCIREAGHPHDSDRPHACSCWALWAD